MSYPNPFGEPTNQKLQQDTTTQENFIFNQSQAEAEIYYDLYDTFLFDIRDELEKTLSSLLHVETKRLSWGASPLWPILEVVLIAASTQIVTTILSKFGEDLYNQLKTKAKDLFTKNKETVGIHIIIVANEISIAGSITFNNYKQVAHAMKSAQQMFDDAYQKRSTNLEQTPQGPIILWKDKSGGITSSQSKFQFHYNYDTSSQKWVLKSIHKLD